LAILLIINRAGINILEQSPSRKLTNLGTKPVSITLLIRISPLMRDYNVQQQFATRLISVIDYSIITRARVGTHYLIVSYSGYGSTLQRIQIA
jgi:hypothetical protein